MTTEQEAAKIWRVKSIALTGDTVETLTEEGALRLAAKVRKFWRERGHIVEVRIVEDARRGIFCLRSEMIGGLPASVVRR